jgi:hypothetical protein
VLGLAIYVVLLFHYHIKIGIDHQKRGKKKSTNTGAVGKLATGEINHPDSTGL